MSNNPLASIVVSSYNYARFLRQAIDSALAQTYGDVEVIVVDDGSTDESPAIIADYGRRIVSIIKENGGQGSALNAGFAASQGDVILFLDSDDVLLPSAVERAAEKLREPGSVKVHWPLKVIDENSQFLDRIVPGGELAEGNLLDQVLREGPDSYAWPPTSGNAWSRQYLRQIMPMPEHAYRTCPDVHLTAWTAFFGSVQRLTEPQSLWRIHGQNSSWRETFDERLAAHVSRWEFAFSALEQHARGKGLAIDLSAWRNCSWFHRIAASVNDIGSVVPMGSTFVLIDEDWWETGPCVAGRRREPFLERGGQYWGPPADNREALSELERMQQAGAKFLVVGWPGFWWLEHYRQFSDYLRSQFRQVIANDRLIVFDLEKHE